MTLQETYTLFEKLKSESTSKYKIKTFDKFLHILSELKNRSFSIDEIESIEKQLDNLVIKTNANSTRRQLRKALYIFEKYLQERFSLITKGHYTNLGIALGSSFGLLFGIIALTSFDQSLGYSLGMVFGMLLGLIIGRNMDAKAAKEGKMI